MIDCIALLLQLGYTVSRAVNECDSIYRAHQALQAEDARDMELHFWPYVGEAGRGRETFSSRPRWRSGAICRAIGWPDGPENPDPDYLWDKKLPLALPRSAE